jgi:DNA topoisomerase-1
MGGIYASLDKDDDVLAVGLNRAVDVLARKLASVRALGPHPADQEPVLVRKGRFGPYFQHGNRVANLPRDLVMDDATLEQAVAQLAEKGKALKPRQGSRKAPAKAAKAAKPAARKKAAKPAAEKLPTATPTSKAGATTAKAKPAAKAAKKPASATRTAAKRPKPADPTAPKAAR